MTPRYQKILFTVLFLASVLMTAVLVRLREHAHDQMLQGIPAQGTTAPAVAPPEQVTFMVADNGTSTLRAESLAFPLPMEPEARARALLNRLLAQYSSPQSQHPLPAETDPVEAVYLMAESDPAPGPTSDRNTSEPATVSGKNQIAIVDLTQNFAATHPSGLETETLTVLSICATLHANLPRVAEVRFLVAGQQQATLHGHADLTQTYLTAASAAASGAQP